MRYYDCGGYPLCSREVLALPALHALPETGEVLFGFHRTPGAGRDTFPVTAPSLLTAEEGVSTLVTAEEPETDPALAAAIAAGRVRAVNLAHPRYEELLPPLRRRERVRVNLLALGDVGSTLLMGLRLLGGDVIDSVGICDVRENVPQRWEMELNQIVSPEGERLPPVEIVSPEEVFDGDVFLFCASRFVPDTAVKTGDVRMAQYRLNRELAALYAQKARQARYRGLFCVVSDPVDPLCRAVLTESNRAPSGEMDYQGLFSHQVRGFGLGVMNARAAYYARKDPRFASFLTDDMRAQLQDLIDDANVSVATEVGGLSSKLALTANSGSGGGNHSQTITNDNGIIVYVTYNGDGSEEDARRVGKQIGAETAREIRRRGLAPT